MPMVSQADYELLQSVKAHRARNAAMARQVWSEHKAEQELARQLKLDMSKSATERSQLPMP